MEFDTQRGKEAIPLLLLSLSKQISYSGLKDNLLELLVGNYLQEIGVTSSSLKRSLIISYNLSFKLLKNHLKIQTAEQFFSCLQRLKLDNRLSTIALYLYAGSLLFQWFLRFALSPSKNQFCHVGKNNRNRKSNCEIWLSVISYSCDFWMFLTSVFILGADGRRDHISVGKSPLTRFA